MRTFVQKPKLSQHDTSAKIAVPRLTGFRQSQKVNSVLHLQRTIGNDAVQRLLNSNAENHGDVSPAKLSQSIGNDFNRVQIHPAEQGHLMRTGGIQTAEPALPGIIGISRTREIDAPGQPHPLALLRRQARTEGTGLPENIKSSWGQKAGRNLSGFRIHNDPESGEAVRAMGANAVNFDNHIFFAPGGYNVHTRAGRKLLAHEVAHGLQTNHDLIGPSAPAAMTRVDNDGALENDAAQLSASLEDPGCRKAQSKSPGQKEPALRGDKQISFSGMNITVRDTYVVYGPGVSDEFIVRFQNALNAYYNDPDFLYRGYNVNFDLNVRRALYNPAPPIDTSPPVGPWFLPTTIEPEAEMIDSSSDSDTSLFYVSTGQDRAGGFFEITLYSTSSEATIAHEVGHYLSDRIGYFSEGYTEGICSRLGICDTDTTPKPEASDDIMGTLSGIVSTFSLSGILDDAIDEHLQELEELNRQQQFQQDLRTFGRALEGDPGAVMWFMRGLSGY